MTFEDAFHGPNAGYVLELYEQYRAQPDSVDEATRRFFEKWSLSEATTQHPMTNGDTREMAAVAAEEFDGQTVMGAVSYAQAIRQYGHLDARIDPLDRERPGDPELDPAFHGITENDLRELPASIVGGPVARDHLTALDAIQALKTVYQGSIGYDYDHIRIAEERQWLREAAESRRFSITGDADRARGLLERLTQVETFELFLQRGFPTKYRFSIEGLDMMVPMLDEVVDSAAADDACHTIAIGMAHRGRLNILTHIMEKPYEQIMAEFKDPLHVLEYQDAIGWTTGDVKYHKGVLREVDSDGDTRLFVTMPPNPSHLEAINPVAVGMARAAGTDVSQPGEPTFQPHYTLQILIHGDAAFPGQGVVAETFNLSQLPGYWTGGTLHIIANNQLGFTTDPNDSRSTIYASDLAKGFKVPIVHVNADDPEACMEAIRLAFAYQSRYEKDFLIDLVGYRRYGHNELDEPGFTQPKMYETVRAPPTVRQLWADTLQQRDLIEADTPQQLVDRFNEQLQVAYDLEPDPEDIADPKAKKPEKGAAKKVDTAVSTKKLNAINDGLEASLADFTFYSRRLENTIRSRREALRKTNGPAIDWATAEELAFATILADGTPIRITGQDSERGTFSHRHAVLHDKNTGKTLTPLHSFPQADAAFEVRNSPLSEAAAIGFEYGYNTQAPERLVIWEAQYGDFVNNGQTIIDEFLVSAREKWEQTPSLVLLLPHGHEGAGPDHSSGRVERFLSMAAKTNLRIANPTSAAQYFHLLRRQARLLVSDPLPLIVLTPKSLLRNPDIFSNVDDLATGRWQPVIDDPDVDPTQVTRLVFCSGKFSLDLLKSEHRETYPHVAIVCLEQLYPFPLADLTEIIERYPNVTQVVWAQEEPKNMGAWEFMGYRLKKLIGIETPVNYVGRRRSSSPAEGSRTAHNVNQAMIIEYTFNWDFAKGQSQKAVPTGETAK